jgi:hypothetical protein
MAYSCDPWYRKKRQAEPLLRPQLEDGVRVVLAVLQT